MRTDDALADTELARKYQETYDRLQNTSNRLYEKSAEKDTAAKYGLGAKGRAGMDAARLGMEMTGDLALNLAAPGAGLASRGLRTFGSAANRAHNAGATAGQELVYAGTETALDVLVEKLGGGLEALYGRTLGGKLAEDICKTLAQTRNGQKALRYLLNAAAEGGEDFLSTAIEPMARAVYDQGASKDTYYGTPEGRKALAEAAGQNAQAAALLSVLFQAAGGRNDTPQTGQRAALSTKAAGNDVEPAREAAALLEEAEALLRKAGFDDSYGTESRKLSTEDVAGWRRRSGLSMRRQERRSCGRRRPCCAAGGRGMNNGLQKSLKSVRQEVIIILILLLSLMEWLGQAIRRRWNRATILSISMEQKEGSAGKKTRQGKRNMQRFITKKSEEESRMQMRTILQRRRPGSALNRSRPFVSMF